MFSITSKSDYYGSKAASKRKQIEKQQKQTWEINSSKTAAVKVIARASQKDEMKWFQISNEEENLRVAAFLWWWISNVNGSFESSKCCLFLEKWKIDNCLQFIRAERWQLSVDRAQEVSPQRPTHSRASTAQNLRVIEHFFLFIFLFTLWREAAHSGDD